MTKNKIRKNKMRQWKDGLFHKCIAAFYCLLLY